MCIFTFVKKMFSYLWRILKEFGWVETKNNLSSSVCEFLLTHKIPHIQYYSDFSVTPKIIVVLPHLLKKHENWKYLERLVNKDSWAWYFLPAKEHIRSVTLCKMQFLWNPTDKRKFLSVFCPPWMPLQFQLIPQRRNTKNPSR